MSRKRSNTDKPTSPHDDALALVDEQDTPDVATAQGPERRTHGASSSRKVLGILGYFEPRRPLASIDQLANAVDVPKSTAYRYVSVLKEMGFLADNGKGGYHLAPRVINMAAAARAAISYADIARPIMHQLSEDTGETVLLLQRMGDNAVCIARAESRHAIRLSYEVGTSFPLHRGAAPGKLLLAFMDNRERNTYLTRAARSDGALAARMKAFQQELEAIRESGIAEAINEIIPDVCGLAAPVHEYGEVIAALAVAGPSFRFQGRVRDQIESALRKASARLSAELTSGPEEGP